MSDARIAWVDYAKGLCIILVVMMHAVHGYEELVGQTGWMNAVVAFAKPFRMPDFFLIAGLFLGRSIYGSTVDYFDRKFVHFAYFYLLWLVIQSLFFDGDVLLSDPAAYAALYGRALIDPITTLWFVHMLAIYYAVTWVLRAVPKWIVFAGALGLQTAFALDFIHTDWTVFDRFCAYYVYFFVGYAAAPYIFKAASWAGERPLLTGVALFVWALSTALAVRLDIAGGPGISFALGMAGAAAIMALGVFMSQGRGFDLIRHAGKHSIVIYLTFFLPVKVAQIGLSRTGLIPDVGTASLMVLIAGIAGPLVFFEIVRRTPLNFLYQRPRAISISDRYRGGAQARVRGA